MWVSGSIKNNVVYACSQGVEMGHDDHDIDAVNNTLFGNSGYAIYFGGCGEAYNHGCPTSGIHIFNNIIYDNFGAIQGPAKGQDVGNILHNNCIFGNTMPPDLAPASESSRAGEVNLDPEFVDYVRGGGNVYQITVNVPVAADSGEIGRQIVSAIRVYERGNGASWRQQVAS